MNDIARRKRARASSLESKHLLAAAAVDPPSSSNLASSDFNAVQAESHPAQQHAPLDPTTSTPTRSRKDLLSRATAMTQFGLSCRPSSPVMHLTKESGMTAARTNLICTLLRRMKRIRPRHDTPSSLKKRWRCPRSALMKTTTLTLSSIQMMTKKSTWDITPLTRPLLSSQCQVQEGLLHRAVHFVWEAEADYHSSSTKKKKKKKKKKKSVTIKDDHFEWRQTSGKCNDEMAILDMKVTARGNNISGGFAQVSFPVWPGELS